MQGLEGVCNWCGSYRMMRDDVFCRCEWHEKYPKDVDVVRFQFDVRNGEAVIGTTYNAVYPKTPKDLKQCLSQMRDLGVLSLNRSLKIFLGLAPEYKFVPREYGLGPQPDTLVRARQASQRIAEESASYEKRFGAIPAGICHKISPALRGALVARYGDPGWMPARKDNETGEVYPAYRKGPAHELRRALVDYRIDWREALKPDDQSTILDVLSNS